MSTEQENVYLRRIHELEKQIARLQTEIKKNSETQYGLRWMDVPEAFEAEAENAVPILEEVKEKAITNDDGKPTHILIEGDNFHALTCLNYTHKGKIDVIYIDPPYNTGSDGFVYKDKRVLDKFPDGSTVPTDHPLRHSYWLSFMHKRLELAKNLLSERGVIFISIDDNEQANLKLLCDQVFGEKNFVSNSILVNNRGGRDYGGIAVQHEYMLIYAKNVMGCELNEIEEKDKKFDYKDEEGGFNLMELRNRNVRFNNLNRPNLCYSFYLNPNSVDDNGLYQIALEPNDDFCVEVRPALSQGIQTVWRWGKEEKSRANLNKLIFGKANQNGGYMIVQKYRKTTKMQRSIWDDKEFVNERGSEMVKDILGQGVFNYPKSIWTLRRVLELSSSLSSTILDFFGGSGTTMHATMQLNEEDGGHRQCILVQQNENNICEAVTYERNKRVMQGYTNAKGEAVAGLGNSMKYYRTAFVGEHKITDITDADKVALTQKAGCLLALGENTLEEIRTAKSYQIFQLRKGDKPTNDFGYTAVYFSGNLMHFADFRREIEQIQAANPLTRIAVYVFTWGDPSIFENEFDDLSGITIKPIPQPILEIYQNINK